MRSNAGNWANTPGSVSGSAPATIATRCTRSGSAQASAAAYWPPIDHPMPAKRPTPSRSIMSSTSPAQSRIVRPGCGSDPPMPGRSGEISRTPTARAAASAEATSSRQANPPCALTTTAPSGAPYSA
jgi:hypothetical protein